MLCAAKKQASKRDGDGGGIGTRHPEGEFGGDRCAAVGGALVVVELGEGVEVTADDLSVATPVHPAADETALLEAEGFFGGDLVEAVAVGRGPGLAGGRHGRRGECLCDPTIEGVVDE